MAGIASFGRLSTEAGVKAFLDCRGMEPAPERDGRRRAGETRHQPLHGLWRGWKGRFKH